METVMQVKLWEISIHVDHDIHKTDERWNEALILKSIQKVLKYFRTLEKLNIVFLNLKARTFSGVLIVLTWKVDYTSLFTTAAWPSECFPAFLISFHAQRSGSMVGKAQMGTQVILYIGCIHINNKGFIQGIGMHTFTRRPSKGIHMHSL